MLDTNRLTRRSALALMGAGALLATSGSNAFSNVTGNRGVSINAADDPDAFLGIEGVDTDQTPTFINRTGNDLTVTLTADVTDEIRFDVGDDGNEVTDSVQFDVDQGNPVEVVLRGPVNSAEIDVFGEFFSEGSSVGSVSLTRTFLIPQSDQIVLTPNVTSAGASGFFRFELENTGDIDVTFASIAIDRTNAGAVEVDSGLEYEGTLVTGPITVVGGTPDENDFVQFNPTVDLNVGETSEFRFNRFRDGRNTDMRGAEVDITIRFSDGSSTTIEMEDS